MTNNVFGTKKSKNTTTTKEKGKRKNPSRAGSRTRNLSHRRLVRHVYTTETTELIDRSQAF